MPLAYVGNKKVAKVAKSWCADVKFASLCQRCVGGGLWRRLPFLLSCFRFSPMFLPGFSLGGFGGLVSVLLAYPIFSNVFSSFAFSPGRIRLDVNVRAGYGCRGL